MAKDIKKILVTGAVGQIGSELTLALRERYGAENVIATGRKTQPSDELRNSGPFHFIDVTNIETVEEIVRKYNIDTVVHMAALLSAAPGPWPQSPNLPSFFRISWTLAKRPGAPLRIQASSLETEARKPL